MDVETFHALNKLFKQLDDKILHHRHADSRGGTIPPECMEEALTDLANAAKTAADILGINVGIDEVFLLPPVKVEG